MRIEPLTAAIGAEISGINLGELDTETGEELRAALLEYKVVGIRNQFLDDAGHVRLAESLGEPWIHPMDRLAGVESAEPSELRVKSDHQLLTDRWHLDVLYAPNPPAFAILRAIDVPPVGGDTMWANLVLAASWLPDDLREQLLGRFTVQSVPDTLINLKQTLFPDFDPQIWRENLQGVRQPLLRRHPETGEDAIFCLGDASVDGLDDDASQKLVAAVTEHATNPSVTCRWRWRNGDVVIWDERCTAHFAARDPWEGDRVLRRLLVEGDCPIAAN
ncbi:MAG: TauD/TfdA family dioxygenase [bacterium]|nr:TauD/TfdA family dioxygenase [bacterium]